MCPSGGWRRLHGASSLPIPVFKRDITAGKDLLHPPLSFHVLRLVSFTVNSLKFLPLWIHGLSMWMQSTHTLCTMTESFVLWHLREVLEGNKSLISSHTLSNQRGSLLLPSTAPLTTLSALASCILEWRHGLSKPIGVSGFVHTEAHIKSQSPCLFVLFQTAIKMG